MTITTYTRNDGPTVTADLLATARRYSANRQDWPLEPRFNPHRRWYHRLATEPAGEVWILSWLPGQSTDLHDHGGSAGAFLVISGVLTERTLHTGTLTRSLQFGEGVYSAGRGRSFGGRHVHQIANTGLRPAVSLHVYSPALREMTRYRIAEGQLVVAAVEQAGADW